MCASVCERERGERDRETDGHRDETDRQRLRELFREKQIEQNIICVGFQAYTKKEKNRKAYYVNLIIKTDPSLAAIMHMSDKGNQKFIPAHAHARVPARPNVATVLHFICHRPETGGQLVSGEESKKCHVVRKGSEGEWSRNCQGTSTQVPSTQVHHLSLDSLYYLY